MFSDIGGMHDKGETMTTHAKEPGATLPLPLKVFPAGHWLDVCGPLGQAIFEIPKSRREMADLIVEACNNYAALRATAEQLARALEESNKLLYDICKDESDEPEVGIFGWTQCHRAVDQGVEALTTARELKLLP
jgi:hypothetical protein